jgi:FolB domain-containing protein
MTTDLVHCHGLILRVRVGFHDYERRIEQAVHVDLTLGTDFRAGPERDRQDGLVDYYELTRHIEQHVKDKAYDLVEALAVDLAQEALRKTPATRVRVRVTKKPLDMPMVDHIWVECERTRADLPSDDSVPSGDRARETSGDRSPT